MPDISPDMVARVDQSYEHARSEIAWMLDEARERLAEHGPAMAAALLSVEHVELGGHDPHQLGGLVGLLLIELVRREVPGG